MGDAGSAGFGRKEVFRAVFGAGADGMLELVSRLSPEWQVRLESRLASALSAQDTLFLTRLRAEIEMLERRDIDSPSGPTRLQGPLDGVALKPVETIDVRRLAPGPTRLRRVHGIEEMSVAVGRSPLGAHLVVTLGPRTWPVVRLLNRLEHPTSWTNARRLTPEEVASLAAWLSSAVRRGRAPRTPRSRHLLAAFEAILKPLV